jgi:hypothetical protein
MLLDENNHGKELLKCQKILDLWMSEDEDLAAFKKNFDIMGNNCIANNTIHEGPRIENCINEGFPFECGLRVCRKHFVVVQKIITFFLLWKINYKMDIEILEIIKCHS